MSQPDRSTRGNVKFRYRVEQNPMLRLLRPQPFAVAELAISTSRNARQGLEHHGARASRPRLPEPFGDGRKT